MAPASVALPPSWTSEPSSPAYGPPACATGGTLASVSVAWSVPVPPSSSFTVRVSLTSPSSVQVTLGFTAVSSSNEQVAPASTPTPATYCHDQVWVSLLPASVAEPLSWMAAPSLPL